MRVGVNVLVRNGADGVGGNPGLDGSVKEDGLVRIVGDLVGLSDGGAGF